MFLSIVYSLAYSMKVFMGVLACVYLCPKVYNLGTGTGYSVLQMVKAMEKASGKEVRDIIFPRPIVFSDCIVF